ncbi:MAG: patatin-like phospholipase family protein [Planctomycetota bacterium]
MALFNKPKVVLALGGGGSRGLAHLGVLKVLEREGVPIDAIVGTSVGAITGAAYCFSPDSQKLAESTLGYLTSDRFKNDHFRRLMFGANDAEQNILKSFVSGLRRSLNFTSLIRKKSIYDGEQLRRVIAQFVPDVDFEDLIIPFAVPAIDLRQPVEVLLTHGNLRTAVVASCSLPGFFPPVEIDKMLLADVGVIGSVPVSAAQHLMPGAMVIAVDLTSQLAPVDNIRRGWESIMRCESIAGTKLNSMELEKADIVLRPQIGEKYWSDFTDLQRLVDAGVRAAEEKMPEIRNRLDGVLRFLRVRSARPEASSTNAASKLPRAPGSNAS